MHCYKLYKSRIISVTAARRSQGKFSTASPWTSFLRKSRLAGEQRWSKPCREMEEVSLQIKPGFRISQPLVFIFQKKGNAPKNACEEEKNLI